MYKKDFTMADRVITVLRRDDISLYRKPLLANVFLKKRLNRGLRFFLC